MAKYVLSKDKRSIADEFAPEKPVLVIVDPSIAKWLLNVMNDEREADKKLAFAKEEILSLKRKILALNQKCARRDSLIEDAGMKMKSGRRKGSKSKREPGSHPNYAERMCPGAGNKHPHLFKPASGRQKMCSECRQIINELKKKVGNSNSVNTVRTYWRGTVGSHLDLNVQPEPKHSSESLLVGATVPEPPKQVEAAPNKLTVEEVLRMKDGPEKRELEKNFTIAEKMEAAKIRNKIEREKWKAIRNRGFSLDNPIVGVGPNFN